MSHLHVPTPLIESIPMSSKSGLKVFLKLENTQPSGSFKIRGIGHLCSMAKEEGKTHFISSSGGNAGFAAAYAGRRLGVKTTVFVPGTTADSTIKKILELDAEVIVRGNVWDETDRYARELAAETEGLYVPPFDHPLIWEGNSTIVDEISRQVETPDAIILSVGGGGLMCGVVEGLHKNGLQHVSLIAVETEGTGSFFASQKAGTLVTLAGIEGIATSLGAKRVARQALEWSKEHEIRSVLVTDRQAASACVEFAEHHRFLVEPACGASLAVVYNHHEILRQAKTVVVIVCGGIGVDLDKLREWQQFR
ncbi:MAG: serine/threonine dehydratase family protein [Spirochaetaceae bacterium]|nr:serine/threonine dehydratase family protein [Spirochaetaceae bacterium]